MSLYVGTGRDHHGRSLALPSPRGWFYDLWRLHALWGWHYMKLVPNNSTSYAFFFETGGRQSSLGRYGANIRSGTSSYLCLK